MRGLTPGERDCLERWDRREYITREPTEDQKAQIRELIRLGRAAATADGLPIPTALGLLALRVAP